MGLLKICLKCLRTGEFLRETAHLYRTLRRTRDACAGTRTLGEFERETAYWVSFCDHQCTRCNFSVLVSDSVKMAKHNEAVKTAISSLTKRFHHNKICLILTFHITFCPSKARMDSEIF